MSASLRIISIKQVFRSHHHDSAHIHIYIFSILLSFSLNFLISTSCPITSVPPSPSLRLLFFLSAFHKTFLHIGINQLHVFSFLFNIIYVTHDSTRHNTSRKSHLTCSQTKRMQSARDEGTQHTLRQTEVPSALGDCYQKTFLHYFSC